MACKLSHAFSSIACDSNELLSPAAALKVKIKILKDRDLKRQPIVIVSDEQAAEKTIK